MPRKKAHVLGKNHATRKPKHVIFFDTETQETKTDETTKELTLKLGYAMLTEYRKGIGLHVTGFLDFTSNIGFHRWVESVVKGKPRVYIVAHNIGFDLRVTGLTKYLTANGWQRKSLVMEHLNLMVRYKKGDTTLFLMNNMQLFNSSLADLGESIGVPKMHVDFDTVTDEELMIYCRRDVEVMRRAWNVWLEYVQENDLGNFQHTIGSQALSAYRHRFMHKTIYIHDHAEATALERESYHGGRVECFRLGQQERKPYYALDINSMYPFVMKHYPVPTKLLHYYDRITTNDFEDVRRGFGYIAECDITLERPLLPIVHNGRMVFPVGRIHGVFAKPELEYAIRAGCMPEVSRCAVYAEEIIFDSFVDFFYSARRRFKEEGNEQFAYFSKLLLNSLYGKFGQRITDYETVGYNPELGDESGVTYDLVSGKEVRFRRLDGITEIETDTREAENAFPAIASYITSQARVHLLSLIEKAGWDHVLYCDTDSLFVDCEGRMRLVDELDNATIGKLKVEGETDDLALFGAKRYRFGNKERSKGISKRARKVGESLYTQEHFESFSGAIRSGRTDRVVIHTVTKKLSDQYTKGMCRPDGKVVPFRFPLGYPE